jgi:tetratricopeptide (TPR) repeat protein
VVLLLEDAFRSRTLADKLGARIALASDGVPFFVLEMIRTLRDSGAISKSPDGSWRETGDIERMEVPQAVRELVEARLRDTRKGEREMLDAAAVAGFEFDARVIAEVLDRPALAVLQDLAEMQRRTGVIVGAGRLHRFDHHQVHEVVYGDLHPELRREYHAAHARVLRERAGGDEAEPASQPGATCVEICRHLLSARDGNGALPWFDPALQHLEGTFQNHEGLRLAEAALDCDDVFRGELRAKVLLRVSQVRGLYDIMGRYDDMLDAAREASAIGRDLGNLRLRTKARIHAGMALTQLSRPAEAEAELRRAVELAAELGDAEVEIGAIGNLGNALAGQGRSSEGREIHRRALQLAEATDDALGQVVGHATLGLSYWHEARVPEGRHHLDRALDLAAAMGDQALESRVLNNLGLVVRDQGDLDAAMSIFERSEALCRELGDPIGASLALANCGTVHAKRGDFAASMRCAQRHLEDSIAYGYGQGLISSYESIGLDALRLGRTAEAREPLERAVAAAQDAEDPRREAIMRWTLGLCHLQESDLEGAEEVLSGALALSERSEFHLTTATIWSAIGELREAEGDRDAARDAYAAAAHLCAKQDMGPMSILFRAQLAALDGGHLDLEEGASAALDLLPVADRMHALFAIWRANGDETHLVAARGLLEKILQLAPESDRKPMRDDVPLHRAILDACREELGDDEVTPGSEAETGVGPAGT